MQLSACFHLVRSQNLLLVELRQIRAENYDHNLTVNCVQFWGLRVGVGQDPSNQGRCMFHF